VLLPASGCLRSRRPGRRYDHTTGTTEQFDEITVDYVKCSWRHVGSIFFGQLRGFGSHFRLHNQDNAILCWRSELEKKTEKTYLLVDHANKQADVVGYDPYEFWLNQVRRCRLAEQQDGVDEIESGDPAD